MDKMKTSLISGAALLALTAAASAGPMSVASSQAVAPPAPIVRAAYHTHGWRYCRTNPHHVWYHHHRHHYAWYRHNGYYYGWNPVGAAVTGAFDLAALPFEALTGWGYNYPYGYPYYAYNYPYGYPYYYY